MEEIKELLRKVEQIIEENESLRKEVARLKNRVDKNERLPQTLIEQLRKVEFKQ